jgi:hypothetical protein
MYFIKYQPVKSLKLSKIILKNANLTKTPINDFRHLEKLTNPGKFNHIYHNLSRLTANRRLNTPAIIFYLSNPSNSEGKSYRNL